MEYVAFIGTILAVLIFSFVKERAYMRHIEKLEEKLMARSLHEYKESSSESTVNSEGNPAAQEDRYVDLDQLKNPFVTSAN